jgi:hypothetical protein
VPVEWWDIIHRKCANSELAEISNSWFYNGSMLKICLSTALYGAYLGIVFDARYLGGTK